MTQFHNIRRIMACVAVFSVTGCIDGRADFDFPVSAAAQKAAWPTLVPLSSVGTDNATADVTSGLETTAARVAALRNRAATLRAPVLSARDRARLINR